MATTLDNRRSSRRKQVSEARVDDVAGVQKIKAALRQTRRLLAKDNLAADVRVATERRLKSLENDLEVAERRRKERTLATRYHKIKFFEKAKILRKIKQCKRPLSEKEAQSPKESATALENRLFELRSQLNYILHYPKLEKYISLFPTTGDEDEQPSVAAVPDDATALRRHEILGEIQEQMRQGVLSNEPELEEVAAPRGRNPSTNSIVKARPAPPKSVGSENVKVQRKSQAKGSGRSEKARNRDADRIEDDDFFESAGDFD